MRPCEDSLAVCLPQNELSLICVPINKALISAAVSLVIRPFTLIDPSVIVYNDSLAVALSIFELPLVDSVFVLFDAESFAGFDHLIIELVTFHLII